MPTKQENKAINKWRDVHRVKILEDNRKVLIAIRDDKTEAAKNKIEAAKLLARMVAGLQPDKVIQKGSSTPQSQEQRELSEKEIMEIDANVHAD